MSINICRIWLGLSSANVNNKYVQNTACIIWLMSIIKLHAEYDLYYLAKVNNKYIQKTACVIWLMSINICRIWLVLSSEC